MDPKVRHITSRGMGLLMLMAVICLVPTVATGEPGDEVWSSRYGGQANGDDTAVAEQLSPDGTRLYVTGRVTNASGDVDFGTVAYNSQTGDQLWASTYDGPRHADDIVAAIAVTPDGTRIFVTGVSYGLPEGDGGRQASGDFATVAYDANTGSPLWAQQYDGPGHGYDHGLLLGATNSRVVVAGASTGASEGERFASVGHDPATGDILSVARFDLPFYGAMMLSPDVTRLYLVGEYFPPGSTTSSDYAAAAFDAATGQQLWLSRYDGGRPGGGPDEFRAYDLSADGATIFITGQSFALVGYGWDYATVAFDATTGIQVWSSRYDNGFNYIWDSASSIAVNPDGTAVYVTGRSMNQDWELEWATVAYNAQSGAQMWVNRQGAEITVSPTGESFYTVNEDQVTAYSTLTGSEMRSWSGLTVSSLIPPLMSRDGTQMFLTGSQWNGNDIDFFT